MTKKTRKILDLLQLIFPLVGLAYMLFDSIWLTIAFPTTLVFSIVIALVKIRYE